MKNFRWVIYIIGLLFIFYGNYYLFLDLLETASLRLTLVTLYVGITILMLVYALKKRFYFSNIDLSSSLIKTILYNLFYIIGVFIVCSTLFRLYTYFLTESVLNFSHVFFRGMLFDVLTVRYFTPLLSTLYVAYVAVFLLFSKEENLKAVRVLNILGKGCLAIIIFVMAYLYGWVPEVKKFVGIEAYYLRKIEGFQYHYEYFLMGIFIFLISLKFSMDHKKG